MVLHLDAPLPSSARPAPRAGGGFAVAALLLAVCFGRPLSGQIWAPQGPGPITGGQVEGIASGEVVGAVNVVAPHPSNASILYAGAVGGGIWKTTTATAASPAWSQQSDARTSTAIGALEFDPLDVTHQTLLAGIGRFSSFSRIGGARSGLLRTTDGGATWAEIGGAMVGRNIIGVAPRGSTLVAAVDVADAFTCANIGIFRSIDTGATWTQINAGIPRGSADVLAADPANSAVLYASIVFADSCDGASNGIYKSTNSGATWTKVSDAAMDAQLTSHVNTHVEIAAAGNVVAVAIVPSSRALGGVFYSTNGGSSWTPLDLPTTFEDIASVGIHPGFQGNTHLSIALDPNNDDLVYIGGDRQPRSFNDTGGFPNSIGAMDFSGRLFRGDSSQPSGSQWTPLTHSGTASASSPHADSRDMAFDAAGNLIEGDDGGIYKRTSPASAAGDWFSLNGDLQATELHDTAFDRVSNVSMGGAQDTGSEYQTTPSSTTWVSLSTADGGDVAVDAISTPGFSIRYSSFQNLSGFTRRTFDSSNMLTATVAPALVVVSGAAFVPQFVTPVAVNRVNGTRLILGGGNSVYESLDRGDTLSEIGAGIVTLASGRNNIAYGAQGNADVLYVGACVGQCNNSGDGLDGVYVRTTAAGALGHSLTPTATEVIQGVVVEPAAPASAFAIDFSTVRRTTNTGSSWSDITGNLMSAHSPGTLRSIEFGTIASDDALFVGADRGVYIARSSTGFSTWSPLGTGLPNTPVFELDFEASNGKLVAGTLGRGAFSIFLPGTPIFADGFESGDTSAWSATTP